jgi:hypothetical protein
MIGIDVVQKSLLGLAEGRVGGVAGRSGGKRRDRKEKCKDEEGKGCPTGDQGLFVPPGAGRRSRGKYYNLLI